MTDQFDDQMTGYAETVETHVEQRNLGGRPLGATKLKISDEIVKQIEGLARIQCTMKEAGAVLGVNETTYSRFLQAHEKALEAWEHGKETGKASLRRNQYKMSETNPTMAIWLGKQMLGQIDVSRQESSGVDGKPIENKTVIEWVVKEPTPLGPK